MSRAEPASAIVRLSHPLSESTPAYGGGAGLRVQRLTSISGGDTANSLRLDLPNHLGTHVDAPSHFFDGAPTLSDYAPEDWIFSRPILVDVKVPSGALVGPEHLGDELPPDTDLLIVRTGHGRRRGEPSYWEGGPGLSAELGTWLRNERPGVRAVGMDLISVTTRLNRAAGREAHRAFLDPAGAGEPIRLIEDMWIDKSIPSLSWAVVVPLELQDADGAPVTVWGFSDDLSDTSVSTKETNA